MISNLLSNRAIGTFAVGSPASNHWRILSNCRLTIISPLIFHAHINLLYNATVLYTYSINIAVVWCFNQIERSWRLRRFGPLLGLHIVWIRLPKRRRLRGTEVLLLSAFFPWTSSFIMHQLWPMKFDPLHTNLEISCQWVKCAICICRLCMLRLLNMYRFMISIWVLIYWLFWK